MRFSFSRMVLFGVLATTTSTTLVAQSTTRFENWYREEYGRPALLEPVYFQIGPKNLVSPTYRPPAVPTVVREGFTNKEARRLAATAATPTDHLVLAAYYTANADRRDAQAAAFEEAAAAYMNGPKIKNLMSPTTGGRYEFFAKALRNEANTTRALAASHERMALIASR